MGTNINGEGKDVNEEVETIEEVAETQWDIVEEVTNSVGTEWKKDCIWSLLSKANLPWKMEKLWHSGSWLNYGGSGF